MHNIYIYIYIHYNFRVVRFMDRLDSPWSREEYVFFFARATRETALQAPSSFWNSHIRLLVDHSHCIGDKSGV